ncbi:isoprenylcysteine carboxylmethyltransferase family protein [Ochrobactrum sp. XJ1]|nr:isoprenylcysteine carboxylmethyltransferase family protein [Ochrobactrum sp. XJ1]
MFISPSDPVQPFKQRKRIVALWVLAILFLTYIAAGDTIIREKTLWRESCEQVGIALVFAGILGRLWSILYVGGRKNSELVTAGPYSISRNPLYFSSMLAITGGSLITGSLIVTVIFPALAYIVFRCTAEREARYLRSAFGAAYDTYASRTPLMLPNLSLFEPGLETMSFKPRLVMSTARDAIFLFSFIPLMEAIEYLRSNEIIAPLFRIL